MTAFEDIRTIRNEDELPRAVWLEPWGIMRTVNPSETLRIVGNSEQNGSFEVVDYDVKTGIYGWPGATIKIYLNDKLIDDLPSWSDDLPPSGKSYRQITEDIFGEPGNTELR
jgi:hypothetical protein